MLPQNEMYSQSLKLLPTVLVVNTIMIFLKESFTHFFLLWISVEDIYNVGIQSLEPIDFIV